MQILGTKLSAISKCSS